MLANLTMVFICLHTTDTRKIGLPHQSHNFT